MAAVTILVHPTRHDARALADETAAWLAGRGDSARILTLREPDLVAEDGRDLSMDDVDLTGTDVAVSMGGDGTFLRAVRLAWDVDVPVLGVNFGRLGYLPDLGPGEIRDALTTVLADRSVIENRCALEVTVSDRSEGGPHLALNEVVLEKTVFGHTVRLVTSIDGEEVLTYSADGVLIATPTGSTAYNLSAGGPILAPSLRAMVITPVAPHLTLDRSLVLTDAQAVSVVIAPDRAAALVIDGADHGRLEPGATITCRVAERSVRVVRTSPHGFGGMLRARLLADRRG